MHNKKRRNNIILGSLIAIVFVMGIGYAAFSTKLNVTGSGAVSSNWNILITNVTSKDIVGTATNQEEPAWEGLTATFKAGLEVPGDSITYDITVSNQGTLDAVLKTISLSENANSAISFETSGLTEGDDLLKNESKTLTVKVTYTDADVQPDNLTADLTVTLDFGQKRIDDNGFAVPDTDHLVTYDYVTNGGESTTAKNKYITEGKDVDLSYTASKTGYDFMGWNTNSQAKTGLDSFTMGAEDVTLYAIFRLIDTTVPIIENVSYTSTTSTITVAVTASDAESDISKYEYSSDGGTTWEDGGTSNTYTFTKLEDAADYNIQVRVTNGYDLTTTSSNVLASTKLLAVPTFVGNSNTITITYPDGCGDTLTCSYIKDDGEEVIVNTKTEDVTFTNNGTLVAKVTDGKNNTSSTYTFQVTAEMLQYDNTNSNIDCDNVQCAIDRIYSDLS